MVQHMASKGGGGSGLPRHAGLDKRLCIRVPEAAEMLGISRRVMHYKMKKYGMLR